MNGLYLGEDAVLTTTTDGAIKERLDRVLHLREAVTRLGYSACSIADRLFGEAIGQNHHETDVAPSNGLISDLDAALDELDRAVNRLHEHIGRLEAL